MIAYLLVGGLVLAAPKGYFRRRGAGQAEPAGRVPAGQPQYGMPYSGPYLAAGGYPTVHGYGPVAPSSSGGPAPMPPGGYGPPPGAATPYTVGGYGPTFASPPGVTGPGSAFAPPPGVAGPGSPYAGPPAGDPRHPSPRSVTPADSPFARPAELAADAPFVPPAGPAAAPGEQPPARPAEPPVPGSADEYWSRPAE